MGITARTQRKTGRAQCGQMTVELAVCIPVLIAVALVVFNAMLFLENCAAFDRLARDAVRVYAATPAHGQSRSDSAVLVQSQLEEAFSEDYLSVSVQVSDKAPGFVTYTATLQFMPTLFGRHFSGTVFGVSIGVLSHTTQLVIDPYRPGVIV